MGKNEYYKTLPSEIQEYFKNYGFIPKDYMEANYFIKNVARLNEKRTIISNYKLENENKTIEITPKDYKLAFLPEVWQTLSIEDRVYITHCAYKDLCKQFYIEDKYNFIILPIDNELFQNTAGYENQHTKELFLNFLLFHMGKHNINYGNLNGFYAYSVLAHEINHMKQTKHSHDISKYKLPIKNLDVYKKSLKFGSLNISYILDHFPCEKLLDKTHYDRFCSTKLNKLKDLKSNIYLGNLLEISSGNIQWKYLVNIVKEVYSNFEIKDFNKDAIINMGFETNPFDYECSKEDLYNNVEFVNKVNALIEIYIIKHDILLDINSTPINQIMLPEDKNNILLKTYLKNEIQNEVIKYEKRLGKCLSAMIDLFYFEKKPKFNEKLFEEIDSFLANNYSNQEEYNHFVEILYNKAIQKLNNNQEEIVA